MYCSYCSDQAGEHEWKTLYYFKWRSILISSLRSNIYNGWVDLCKFSCAIFPTGELQSHSLLSLLDEFFPIIFELVVAFLCTWRAQVRCDGVKIYGSRRAKDWFEDEFLIDPIEQKENHQNQYTPQYDIGGGCLCTRMSAKLDFKDYHSVSLVPSLFAHPPSHCYSDFSHVCEVQIVILKWIVTPPL